MFIGLSGEVFGFLLFLHFFEQKGRIVQVAGFYGSVLLPGWFHLAAFI